MQTGSIPGFVQSQSGPNPQFGAWRGAGRRGTQNGIDTITKTNIAPRMIASVSPCFGGAFIADNHLGRSYFDSRAQAPVQSAPGGWARKWTMRERNTWLGRSSGSIARHLPKPASA